MIAGLGVLGVAAAAAGTMAYAVRGRSATLLAPSHWRGPAGRRAIAVTFDDGPSESTPELLDVLDEHQARCTFFPIGRNIERLPEIAKELARRGHEVGNHSYTHSPFYLRHPQFLEDEIAIAQDVVEGVSGQRPVWLRVPYGCRWFGLKDAQQRHGLTGVMWSGNGLDWKKSAKAVHARLKGAARSGAILLLHDGRERTLRPDIRNTIEAVRRLLPELREQGYHLCTVSELLCQKQRSNASSGS
ncbi:MAG: polysaccharide deacetylase family protein [Bryobacterales bacterium]|nr:polysaccharide deacetylase family protein [Bryobacterales bacterium]